MTDPADGLDLDALERLIYRVDATRVDLNEFDGDKRGIAAALVEAERERDRAAIKALPALVAKVQQLQSELVARTLECGHMDDALKDSQSRVEELELETQMSNFNEWIVESRMDIINCLRPRDEVPVPYIQPLVDEIRRLREQLENWRSIANDRSLEILRLRGWLGRIAHGDLDDCGKQEAALHALEGRQP